MDKNANFILKNYIEAADGLKKKAIIPILIGVAYNYFNKEKENYTATLDNLISIMQKFSAIDNKGTFVSVISGMLPKIAAERNKINIPKVDISSENSPEDIKRKIQTINRAKIATKNINASLAKLKAPEIMKAYEDEVDSFSHRLFQSTDVRITTLLNRVDGIANQSVDFCKNADNLINSILQSAKTEDDVAAEKMTQENLQQAKQPTETNAQPLPIKQ